MSTKISKSSYKQEISKSLISEFQKRVIANPPYVCPVELNLAFLKLCHAQSCGKCTPCREGLGEVVKLHEDLLAGKNEKGCTCILKLIENTLSNIKNSADCAIGKEASKVALEFFKENYADYEMHAKENLCSFGFEQPIPCVSLCPAHVDVPGYMALVHDKRYADAIKLIRKDNPFPTACGLICEHPCENRCRRRILDQPINIRGIKRYAVDMCHADTVPAPACMEKTGKKVAIIGGGPSGLTCAYFLQLMGHEVTVFEEKKQLGGMMRYGIPEYRFPRERLDEDIKVILSTGVKVNLNTKIGKDVELSKLKADYDAIYVAIGAQTDKKIKLDGIDAKNVYPAVTILGEIGDNKYPDFTGLDVVVIGGGNVAVDCARTALRCKAKSARMIYRRKITDMTALPEEISSAIEEGVKIETLKSPFKIIKDADSKVTSLETEQQMCSFVDSAGRIGVRSKTNAEHIIYKADVIIIATGQDVETKYFEDQGISCNRGVILTDDYTKVNGQEKIFAGGDCVFGPATVIKAIQAGKSAARSIDNYFGFNHEIKVDVQIPEATVCDEIRCGRIDMVEKDPEERIKDCSQTEILMSEEEMIQETWRCLRCDHKGCSLFKGGRELSW